MIMALVPLKELTRAKSRLGGVLTPEERETLSLTLLDSTVAALKVSERVDRIAVVTAEREVCIERGVEWLPDTGELNSALQAAVEVVASEGAETVLIVPADLPYIEGQSIREMVDGAGDAAIAAARTADGGTGALLMRLAEPIRPSFGPDSYKRHLALARERGLSPSEVEVPGLSFDLDTEEDLAAFRSSTSHLKIPGG
jgi:2-phospho-L-lactate guanylyltransferase